MALITNLQAYYKMSNTSDSVGGFTLTNNNSVAFNPGKIGNAADFGASNPNKYLNTTQVNGLAFNTNYSINFWLNVTTQPANNATNTPFRWEDETSVNNKGNFEFQMFNNAGTQQVYVKRNDANGMDQSAGDASPFTSTGVWYMCTLTWDGSNFKFYLNGSGTATSTIASTRTGTAANPTGNGTFTDIGADNPNSRFFSGLIDELGMWNRLLTASEITQLYNNGTGLQYPFITTVPRLMMMGIGS